MKFKIYLLIHQKMYVRIVFSTNDARTGYLNAKELGWPTPSHHPYTKKLKIDQRPKCQS